MSLPHFVEAGDYIVSPSCVARLRRTTRDGSPVVLVRFRATGDGPDDEIEGDDARRLFEAFRALASSAGLPAPTGPTPGAAPGPLEAADSVGSGPGVVRLDPGDEASGTE